jgi:hypothetical protein
MTAFQSAMAVELSGRLSLLGSLAQAGPGEYYDIENNDDHETLTADQQSARLMLDGYEQDKEWSLQFKVARKHWHGFEQLPSSAAAFRYRDAAEDWYEQSSQNSTTSIGYELDRLVYKHHFDTITVGLGRQPIDWGSGRFWQPLNVFGAFAPTDLDTDYKPGIDALNLGWFPLPYSSLNAVFVPKSDEHPAAQASGAIYYRGQVGERLELSLLGGHVLGNRVIGGAFESHWRGMGWRIEGTHYTLKSTQEKFLFWIAGIDYQFENATLISVEWYENDHGTTTQEGLIEMINDPLVRYGLQPYLGEHLLGLTLERDMTPLLQGSYTLLATALRDEQDHLESSLLHQFTLNYSLSDESDLLVSLISASGEKLNPAGVVQSEFGHIPTTLTLRIRFYF